MATPPKWALDAARVYLDAVVAWVEVATGTSSAPILIVTGNEVVWVKRDFIIKRVHRVPRENIISVGYDTGIEWDTLTLNVAGDNFPDTRIRIDRIHRADAWRVLEELLKDAA